jgi:hypothetical protein
MIDIWYLTSQLSRDAVPALFAARTSLPPAIGDSLYNCIYPRTDPRETTIDAWYEFNIRRTEEQRLRGEWEPRLPAACPGYSD